LNKGPGKIILLDGGTGQEISKRATSEPTPLWSVDVMMNEPGIVQAVHEDFIHAGATIIGLNNYTASRIRLQRHGAYDRFGDIHGRAKALARAAVGAAGNDKVRIAACLPPLAASYKADLVPDFDTCLADYQELVDILDDGVDLFMGETFSTILEVRAAIAAARPTGKPVWIGLTLDDDADGLLRSGETLSDAIDEAARLGTDAILVNCSMPETIERALPTLLRAPVPVGAYPNGFQSISALDVGGTVSSLSAREDLGPETFARIAMRWADAGLSIIGGCCEVGPDHIAVLRKSLNAAGYEICSEL